MAKAENKNAILPDLPQPPNDVAEMREVMAKTKIKAEITRAAWLYYGQKPPIPKSVDKGSPEEDRVYNILAELDQAGRLRQDMRPREVRKLLRYRGTGVSPRTIQRAYERYVAEHAVK
jgi:hypothetical protein